MATSQELLAASLAELKKLQGEGMNAIASGLLSRVHRERLKKAGFLREVLRGWYLVSRPADPPGDSTAWDAHWREFIGRYASQRFARDWYLSPELSLLEQTGNPIPTRQLVIMARQGHNNVVTTKLGWTIFDLATPELAPRDEIEERSGVRILSIPYALTQVSEAFFRTYRTAAQVALGLLDDVSGLSRILLTGGKSVVAGRLAGALSAVGRDRDARELVETMTAAGHRIQVTNPFDSPPVTINPAIKRSPYALRVHEMWMRMRERVIKEFPSAPGLPRNASSYLNDIDARYVADAYNSLSIEGYTVTEELIEKIRLGKWNPDDPEDKRSRDAMAAKGYLLAHDAVKKSIGRILAGKNPGAVLREDHASWNRALWAPSVQAGVIRAQDLAGYRNGPVYIKGADHVPPPREGVRDAMPAFFDLLEAEENAAARAVLGHFVFVFIHPYNDGNGRLGRFLMNAMMASGGYPWTVIEVARRQEYMVSLNKASYHGEIGPFAKFVSRELSGQVSPRYKPKRVKR